MMKKTLCLQLRLLTAPQLALDFLNDASTTYGSCIVSSKTPYVAPPFDSLSVTLFLVLFPHRQGYNRRENYIELLCN